MGEFNKDLRGYEGDDLCKDPKMMLVNVDGMECYRFIEFTKGTDFIRNVPVTYIDETISWPDGRCVIVINQGPDGWEGVI